MSEEYISGRFPIVIDSGVPEYFVGELVKYHEPKTDRAITTTIAIEATFFFMALPCIDAVSWNLISSDIHGLRLYFL
jgi:hypothetical protein